MKWFYNLKFNRIFCVLTACFVLFLGCFGVFKFTPKNEPIQASAYGLDMVDTNPQYFVRLDEGISFSLAGNSYTHDMMFEGRFDLFSSTYNYSFSYYFVLMPDSFYSELFDSSPNMVFFNYDSTNNRVVLSRDSYIYFGPLSGSGVSITYYNFESDYGWSAGGDVSIPLTYIVRSWGSASSEDIAQAEQEGFEDGLGVAYSHVASKSIFESSQAFAYDLSGNLLSNRLSFVPDRILNGSSTPIYSLVSDIDLPIQFELRISLMPFIDYTLGQYSQPLDYICINNQGLTSSIGNNFSVYSSASGYRYFERDSPNNGFFDMSIGDFEQGLQGVYSEQFSSFTFDITANVTQYLTELRFIVNGSALRSKTIAYFSTKKDLRRYVDYYNNGDLMGYNDGFNVGFSQGESSGKTAGYSQGLAEGLANASLGSFTNLFTAAIDAPIKAFLGLLDFEILGQDMQVLFLSLLTGALVIAAFRLFSGGK